MVGYGHIPEGTILSYPHLWQGVIAALIYLNTEEIYSLLGPGGAGKSAAIHMPRVSIIDMALTSSVLNQKPGKEMRHKTATKPMKAIAALFLLSLTIEARTEISPTQVIQTMSDQMIEALRDNREVLAKDPGRIHALVDTIAIPHIDVEFFSRYVLGHQWRAATPMQRKRFQAAFKTYVTNSYANVLLKYTDQTVQVLPLSQGDMGRRVVTVHSKIKGGGGQPISVDYRLHQSRKGWRICDIVIEGVSLGISYRNSFSEEVSHKGLDSLIADLERHNAEHVPDAVVLHH